LLLGRIGLGKLGNDQTAAHAFELLIGEFAKCFLLGHGIRITGRSSFLGIRQNSAVDGQPALQEGRWLQGVQELCSWFCRCCRAGKLAQNLDPRAPKVIDELGLNAFKDVTFFHGFEGAALRSLVAADVSGPRKGLAQLTDGKPFSLEELPPLPTDLVSFTAMQFDAAALFDSAVQLLESMVPPDDALQVKAMIAKANEAAGVARFPPPQFPPPYHNWHPGFFP